MVLMQPDFRHKKCAGVASGCLARHGKRVTAWPSPFARKPWQEARLAEFRKAKTRHEGRVLSFGTTPTRDCLPGRMKELRSARARSHPRSRAGAG